MINANINVMGIRRGGITDTSPTGRQVFLVIGDSISRGSAGDGVGPALSAGVGYATVDGITITSITNDDINPALGFAPATIGTQYPQFCQNYNSNTTYKPVIVCRGVAGSTALSGGTGTWSDNSLYGPAITACNTAMATIGVSKPKAIFIILGINDAGLVTSLPSIQTALASLISRLKVSYPNTDIIVSQIGKLAASDVDARLTAIRGYWKDIVVANSNVYMVGHLGSFEATSLLNVDGLHPNISGCNSLGQMWAEWFQNSAYSKKSRSVMSSHFDILSTGRKNAIATAIAALGTAYDDADALYYWKTSNTKNQYLDWAFLQNPTPQGGNQADFIVNDSIASTVSKFFGTGLDPSITAIKSSAANRYFVLKIKANSSPAGDVGSALEIDDGATTVTLLDQFTIPDNRVRGGINYNPAAGGSLLLFGETAFANNSAYGVSVSGGTQSLNKNGSSVTTGAQGSSPSQSPHEIQIGTATGVGGNLIASYQYYLDGKSSTANQVTVYSAMEALVAAW